MGPRCRADVRGRRDESADAGRLSGRGGTAYADCWEAGPAGMPADPAVSSLFRTNSVPLTTRAVEATLAQGVLRRELEVAREDLEVVDALESGVMTLAPSVEPALTASAATRTAS